jgi:hypothetical protein
VKQPDDMNEEWTARQIDGLWCVGLKGNLDTIHDATLRITGGWLSDEKAKIIAETIVRQHNAERKGV